MINGSSRKGHPCLTYSPLPPHPNRSVAQGNRLKFGQNKVLRRTLLATGELTLVEAAPNDRIWGIGRSVKDAAAGATWDGLNLLGRALMQVRSELRAKHEGAPPAPSMPLPAAPAKTTSARRIGRSAAPAACPAPPAPPTPLSGPEEAVATEASAPVVFQAAGDVSAPPLAVATEASAPVSAVAFQAAGDVAAPLLPLDGKLLRYYVVVDFEATCERDDRLWPNEIIEFPAVLLDAVTLATVDEFRALVRPTERPRLTAFCTELTSITQADVDAAEPLAPTLKKFKRWLGGHGLLDAPRTALTVTCGDWDLGHLMPSECGRKGLDGMVPAVLRRWCNVKLPFAEATASRKSPGMGEMLKALHLPLVGHHHLGIDDSRNIAQIAASLARDRGIAITETGGNKLKSEGKSN